MYSSPVKIIREIWDLYMHIHSTPQLTVVISITIIELPKAYAMLLGRYWTTSVGGIMSMAGIFMIIPHQHKLVRVEREFRHWLHIEGIDEATVKVFFDETSPGIYIILMTLELEERVWYFYILEPSSIWTMWFNGAKSKFSDGVVIILEDPIIHPLPYWL